MDKANKKTLIIRIINAMQRDRRLLTGIICLLIGTVIYGVAYLSSYFVESTILVLLWFAIYVSAVGYIIILFSTTLHRKVVKAMEKNKLPLAALICMLAGPLPIVIGVFYVQLTGHIYAVSFANASMWVAIGFPALSWLLAVISFFQKDYMDTTGKRMSCFVLMMCNPISYVFYCFLVIMIGIMLANESLM